MEYGSESMKTGKKCTITQQQSSKLPKKEFEMTKTSKMKTKPNCKSTKNAAVIEDFSDVKIDKATDKYLELGKFGGKSNPPTEYTASSCDSPSGDMIPSYSGCFVDAVNPNPFSSIKKLNQSFLPLYFLPSI